MVMGQRRNEADEPLWVATTHLSDSPQHPFYEHLNDLLRAPGFDRLVEQLCHEFYSSTNGRVVATNSIRGRRGRGPRVLACYSREDAYVLLRRMVA